MEPRDRLIARLVDQPEPRLMPIDEFLAGNEDLGSIGCNLPEHPGMATFRRVFAELAARADVESMHAQIAELDPGGDSWPFADTVYVVGTISREELSRTLASLEPDEVVVVSPDEAPPTLENRSGAPVHLAWWD